MTLLSCLNNLAETKDAQGEKKKSQISVLQLLKHIDAFQPQRTAKDIPKHKYKGEPTDEPKINRGSTIQKIPQSLSKRQKGK